MASLIQQRFALNRLRLKAHWTIFAGTIGSVSGVVLALAGPSSPSPPSPILILWIGLLISGLVWMRRYRRAVREFEAEHGVGAGKQN